ncbi:hypothetical protein VTP01DRAFT_9210 [Rhizomucor pusillus]|uniref:uncharacterized protein n=1 Tax=Rhizomucor pusillus TaxID=4840 RepID=UPI00374423E3
MSDVYQPKPSRNISVWNVFSRVNTHGTNARSYDYLCKSMFFIVLLLIPSIMFPSMHDDIALLSHQARQSLSYCSVLSFGHQ